MKEDISSSIQTVNSETRAISHDNCTPDAYLGAVVSLCLGYAVIFFVLRRAFQCGAQVLAKTRRKCIDAHTIFSQCFSISYLLNHKVDFMFYERRLASMTSSKLRTSMELLCRLMVYLSVAVCGFVTYELYTGERPLYPHAWVLIIPLSLAILVSLGMVVVAMVYNYWVRYILWSNRATIDNITSKLESTKLVNKILDEL